MQTPTLIADRFILERPVGAGGMGTVYRAIDRASGAPVALKLAARGDDQLRARARAEADALAALDHPAIVRLVAHGIADDGRPFLAMEWLDGEDLGGRLDRAPLTPLEAALLGERVAGALAAAHARGVVHRDIKPSNLFLPSGDVARVMLVDFGIARVAHTLRRLTATGVRIGTPGYMAPEQVMGSTDLGPAADLFALGAVLFECLAGQPAFPGASIMAALAKVLLDQPPRLDAVRADLPLALVELVTRLLAKHPDDRPPAAEVAAVLADSLPALEGAAAADQAPAPAPAGITGAEQRLVCVLLIRPSSEKGPPSSIASDSDTESAAALGATLPADEPTASTSSDPAALEWLRAALAPAGGRVDRLLDGAFVASWGSGQLALRPQAPERPSDAPRDQAMRAAHAALLIRRRLPDAALALASGLTELRGVLPVGPALDRAAALLDAAEVPAEAILVDDVTAGLLDARFELRPTSAGLSLTKRRALDEEEARLLLGRPAPCVGRERELRLLTDLLDECVVEQVARCVLVTGPPGIGKSRLRHELLSLARLRGDIDVWTAGADELGAGSPFALLGAALQRAAGVRPGDPLEQRHAWLERRLARHVPEMERARIVAFLGEIAAAPFPAGAHPTLGPARRNPAMMAEQIRRAWLDLLGAETAAHPVLLVLEDLHWGDAPSLQLIDAALGALKDRSLMVLGLARPELPERFPRLWAERNVQDCRLDGLTRRAATRLIRHALPKADDTLVERLSARAEGNAFYLEELIRAAESGHGDALPETVVAMVQARLAALPAEDRRLLRAASVFGEVFWQRGVLSLLGSAERAVPAADRFDALVDREVLVRRPSGRFPAEGELAFRHALLREGAYAALPEADCIRAHRLAATWLEEAGETDPLLLAAHHERGGEPARAAACYHRAAERALAGNDPPGALRHAERALALSPDDALRPRVLRALMEASWFAGHPADALRWADEILATAPRGSGPFCAAAQARFLVLVQRVSEEAIPFGIASTEGVEPTAENAGPLLRLLSAIALILGATGNSPLGEPYWARTETLVEAFGESVDPGALGMFHFGRSQCRLLVEIRLEQALREAEKAIHCFETASDRLYEGIARFARGNILWRLGAFKEAEAELRRAMERSAPTAHSALVGRACLALVLVDLGALEEAQREATHAIEDAQAAMDRLAEGVGRRALASVFARQEAFAEAERELHAALELGSSSITLQGERVSALAEVKLRQGKVAEALSLAREASGPGAGSSAIARLMARSIEAEAELAAGERSAARALLSEVAAELRAIAACIEDEELREAFLTRGPWSARVLRLAEAEGLGPAAP